MDQNQQNPNPVNSAPAEAPKKHGGPIIASLIIVIVLIVAALYVFASRLSKQNATENETSPQDTTAVSVPVITNTADDVQSLQNDLNSSLQDLDKLSL